MRAKESQKTGSKADNDTPETSEEIPETIKIDITMETYIAAKLENLARVPKLARPFVNQYFDFLKKLEADQVLDWMEGNERLKDLYKKASFAERIAFAGARGLIKSSRRIKEGAEKAINWQVAAYTIRFENPEAWEVIEAFGDEGIDKLKQGIEDIKVILKLKEEAD